MLDFLKSHIVASTLCVILLGYVGRLIARAYAHRKRMRRLTTLPHSWIWGHLKLMNDILQDAPGRVHPHALILRIQKKYNVQTDYFYLDLWPFGRSQLTIFDPDVAQQVTVEHSQPKHPDLIPFLLPLAGPGDLVTSDGPHWKKWRSIMNPGFAASHLMTLVPGIVDESAVFVEKLMQKAASKEVFRLEEAATRLTVDIIGKVTLDIELGTQNGENEMVTAFREQVHLLPNEGAQNPLKMYYPANVIARWRNGRIMDKYIGKVLDERFAKQTTQSKGTTTQKKQRRRGIMDLALDAYQQEDHGARRGTGMDQEFKKAAITQIRTFIFAGHDTTSSAICYALYELQRHPECLARLRKEHDEVLGTIEAAPQVIQDSPHVLNRLEYTLAVLRETLRLWPPASSVRAGQRGFFARDPKTGEALETEGLMLWVVAFAVHRSEHVWGPTANTFDPTRFLPENQSKLPANAWRPFEKGPRNCIGQDLALLEGRIILALVARRFDFRPAFDSLDLLKDDGTKYATDETFRKGRLDVDGEVAYPVLIGTAKPREGMPVRVKKRM